ncbi:MAG: cytochrome c peroxidase [Bacteroidia bacterium]|nr:cytochrome c peroxidase [Bacteroidia bacterium]
MRRKFTFGFVMGAIVLLFNCTAEKSQQANPEPFSLNLPTHFPELISPEGNELTEKRIELGRRLFYETALSLDSSLSCASCHLQTAAFSDHNPISIGINGKKGNRNVPTLANIGYHPYFFAEGGSPSLEMQMIGPICSDSELGFNARELITRLAGDSYYDSLAQEAYGRKMDLFSLTRSIAAFERSLISGNSAYDRFLQGDPTALSTSAKRGFEGFMGKWGCANCHSGHLLTNYLFENVGLYKEYKDRGRVLISLDEKDVGKFKVPTLRNIALTYPYMHDGSIATLREVIDFYEKGGEDHPNKHMFVRRRRMSEEDKADLLAFMHSLTDSSFLQNPQFAPPKK